MAGITKASRVVLVSLEDVDRLFSKNSIIDLIVPPTHSQKKADFPENLRWDNYICSSILGPILFSNFCLESEI